MGNWRTVHIVGSCPADELAVLDNATFCDYMAEDMGHFGPLSWSPQPSLCGVNRWPAEAINAVGNLSERDCSVDAVAAELRRLVQCAPGLALAVHCGGERETDECVATITVAAGVVTVGPPAVDRLPALGSSQGMSALAMAMSGLRLSPLPLTPEQAERIKAAPDA